MSQQIEGTKKRAVFADEGKIVEHGEVRPFIREPSAHDKRLFCALNPPGDYLELTTP